MVDERMQGAPPSVAERLTPSCRRLRSHPSRRRARVGGFGLLVLLCCSAIAERASANSAGYRLAILDLESDDVHDNFAGELTKRLDAAMTSRTSYRLHETHVSLLQLSLSQNCDPAQAECLGVLAVQLQVDGFIFGKVTHEGGAPVALLRRYDMKSQSVDRTSLVTFASREVQPADLERGAEHLLNDLLGPPSATSTALVAPPLAAGAAAADAGQPGAESTGISGRTTLGYALIAGSLLAAGMTAVSFIEVYDAEQNANYTRYRYAVGDSNPGVSNVCHEADAGHMYGLDAASFKEAQSSCHLGNTFEVLQFVFLGTALVTGGIGAYLLATDDTETEPSPTKKPSTASWHVRPNFAFGRAGLDARVSF
jgi:hypothetical protein